MTNISSETTQHRHQNSTCRQKYPNVLTGLDPCQGLTVLSAVVWILKCLSCLPPSVCFQSGIMLLLCKEIFRDKGSKTNRKKFPLRRFGGTHQVSSMRFFCSSCVHNWQFSTKEPQFAFSNARTHASEVCQTNMPQREMLKLFSENHTQVLTQIWTWLFLSPGILCNRDQIHCDVSGKNSSGTYHSLLESAENKGLYT